MSQNTDTKQHFIILNGISSAGKSSIAQEIQKNPDIFFVHLQLDMFWNAMPADYKERIEPDFLANRRNIVADVVKVFLNQQAHVVFDTVIRDVPEMVQNFKDFDPFVVGVKASLDDLRQREKQRGDREIGQAEEQYAYMHKDAVYDFEVNTSEMTSAEAATKILEAYHLSRLEP